ncbi:hypothetical protein ACI3K5_03825 [Streptomyces sp. MPA0124]|uniref:hypothetical protein n=1 Tax=Streptomyces sp. MPA0124 TaxID=3378069 RepID=UPI003853122C
MMMRIIFGIVLGVLVAYPTLAVAVTNLIVQPPVIAAAAGIWAWPRITRRVRGWWA